MTHTGVISMWTYEDIERDWLAGARIAMSAADVVAAFETCERLLGREWIDRRFPSQAKGTGPTLGVTTMGEALATLQDVTGNERLLDKLRSDDLSAIAELRAIHLLRSQGNTRIELEPLIKTKDGERRPDFRIRQEAEPWVYVEVTQPDISDAQAHVDALLSDMVEQIASVEKPFSLEVFLRREPNQQEAASVISASLAACLSGVQEAGATQMLPDELGWLTLNQHSVGHFEVRDQGDEPLPTVSSMKALVGPGGPNRQVAIRMAYADERAERFLTSEARQLPTDAPGLVMVDMQKIPGGVQSWQPLVRRRFQPKMHTRVGSVCLFFSGSFATQEGQKILTIAKLLANPHARIPLPPWIGTTVVAVSEQFRSRMAGVTATS
jgi:hypothetical protein